MKIDWVKIGVTQLLIKRVDTFINIYQTADFVLFSLFCLHHRAAQSS